MGKKDRDRKPIIPSVPRPKRTPRPPQDTVDSNQCTPTWRFSSVDLDGKWGWRNIDADTLIELRGKLSNLETMRWAEIINNRHCHAIKASVLCKEARDRLVEIQLDDTDELYQLSFSNKQRLFGVRHKQVFDLIWWDPEHTVYPVAKKNT